MFSIPNDNYTSFRIQKFAEYYGIKHSHNDSDVYNLSQLCKDGDEESKCWVSFLYSTCYCVSTTAFLYCSFPTIQSAQEDKLIEFWDRFKSVLIFQSDRRWVKQNNEFVKIVLDYKNHIEKSSQYNTISSIWTSQTNLFNWFTSIHYCGRFSAMLFMEAIFGLSNKSLTQEAYLDWNECKTCAQGILTILYKDDLALEIDKTKGKRNLSKEEQKYLDCNLKFIIDYVENYLGYKTNFARIVGYLCSYYKLYKQTRYTEFYTDRRLTELLKYQKTLPQYSSLWGKLFQIRFENVPHRILGELNGWDRIRKEKCGDFIKYGKL